METLSYKAWQPLTEGASIDIIAPAGGCEWDTLEQVKALLKKWKLKARVSPNLFGDDLLCANTDEERFAQLQEALFNSESNAIWCLRGGYGCTRLIPALLKLQAPETNKLFIGFSDITALHVFLQQKWYWQTLHGPSANQVAYERIDSACIDEFKKLIFGELKQLMFSLIPLNKTSNHSTIIESPITGGTLTLIQASLGTLWQVDAKNKILFLEDVNEPAYRIDRMLQHLQQSGTLQHIKAILLGDFTFTAKSSSKPNNPDHLIQSILKRFAEAQRFPVFHIPGIGHGEINRSLPLGSKTSLDLNKNQLTIKITG